MEFNIDDFDADYSGTRGPQGRGYSAITIDDVREHHSFLGSEPFLAAVEAARDKLRDDNSRHYSENSVRWLNISEAKMSGRFSSTYAKIADELYRRASQALSPAGLPSTQMHLAACRVVEEFLAQGPITPLLTADATKLADVRIARFDRVFIDEHGKWTLLPGARFRDPDHLRGVIENICNNTLMVRFSVKDPIVDAQLPSGDRIHIVHEYVDGSHTMVIRRFPRFTWTLQKYVETRSLNAEAALFLSDCVRAEASSAICGGTGSGKTSLLNALTGCIPNPTESLTIVEDSRELRPHPRLVNIIGHQATATVSARLLVKSALREAPRRIIFGEVRDGIMADFCQAANTGHDGSMTTIHANTAAEAVPRMLTLYAQGDVAGLTSDNIRENIGLAFDLIVVAARLRRRNTEGEVEEVRRITEIAAVDYDLGGSGIKIVPIYVYRPDLDTQVRTENPIPPRLESKLAVAAETYGRTSLADLEKINEEAIAADAERNARESREDLWAQRRADEDDDGAQ